MVIIYTESVFDLNKFKRPKVLEDRNAIYTLLTRLMLLEPGTIQSHPDMGIGIVSRYRFSLEGRAGELKRELQQQIEKYLPELLGVEIDITEQNKTYIIKFIIDNTVYDFSYNGENGSFESLVNL